jgi:CxxC motif-containing protein (DUF1111 family)
MKASLKSRLRKRLGPAGIVFGVLVLAIASGAQNVGEAPAGFDNQTNGAISQSEFHDALMEFSQVETPAEGLGPVFNAESCVACHLSAGAVGGGSQVQELRAGHNEYLQQSSLRGRFFGRRDQNEGGRRFTFGQTFVPADAVLNNGSVIEARSLVNQRAICAGAQSHVDPEDNVRAGRLSLPLFGDGFVEAVPDDTFRRIAAAQAAAQNSRVHGQVIEVPVLESEGVTAVGRFGWKNQHASLLSFSADAYLNEMGITNQLLRDEVTTVCQPDGIAEPNNTEDIETFAAFMRALKVPPRDGTLAATQAAQVGEALFNQIGCATCHVSTLRTATAGTVSGVLGGTYSIPPALADKVFHPYGDFLLHDIGTGDGIVQNGGDDTANKVRTMPLWGLRTRTQLIHDGLSPTYEHAILRHRGEALDVIRRYYALTPQQKQNLYTFLRSL